MVEEKGMILEGPGLNPIRATLELCNKSFKPQFPHH